MATGPERASAGFRARLRAHCQRDLLDVLVAFHKTLLVLVVTAGVMVLAARLLLPAPNLELVRQIFVEEQRGNVIPEPRERLAYLACVLLLVPAILMWLRAGGGGGPLRQAGRLHAYALPLAMAWLGVATVLLFGNSRLLAYLLGQFDGQERFMPYVPGNAGVLACTVLATAGGFAVMTRPAWWGVREAAIRMERRYRAWAVGMVVVCVLFALLGVRIRSAGAVYGDLHFEAVFYAVSQVMAGKTLLADLPAQYGLYAELLRPVFAVFGFSTIPFIAVMVGMQALAFLALLWATQRLLRTPVLRYLVPLCLCYVVGSTYIAAHTPALGYEYYQIWPIRFFFPAVSVLAFLVSLRRGLATTQVLLLSALVGVALLWNMDSGIPVWGALVVSIAARLAFGPPAARPARLAHMVICLAVPLLLVGLFFLYLGTRTAQPIHLGDWFKYQRIFYAAGFGMLPLQLGLQAWVAVAGIYVLGLTAALHQLRREGDADNAWWSMVLYLCILGIGLFTYFQGRSEDVVLSFVLWPALLVAFILVDRLLRACRCGLLPTITVLATAPMFLLAVILSTKMVVGLPAIARLGHENLQRLAPGQAEGALETNVRFIRQRAGDAHTAVLLDPGQAVLFAELGMASALRGPGVVETLLRSDREALLQQLLQGPAPLLFVRLDKDGALPRAYATLATRYEVAGVSAAGLAHLVPRPGGPARP